MQTKKQLLRAMALAWLGGLTKVGFAAAATPAGQTLYSSGSQQSFKGPETYFTGEVQVEMLFPANDTAHYSGAYVTFAPNTSL